MRILSIIILSVFLFTCSHPTSMQDRPTESWEYEVKDADTTWSMTKGTWTFHITDDRITGDATYEIWAEYYNTWLRLEVYYVDARDMFIYVLLLFEEEHSLSLTTHEDFEGYKLKIFKIGATQ